MAFYADKLCITPRHLGNIVQAHYGKSPKEAIDVYTIMQIRLDLLQSDTPLADLAYRYNFCSPQEYRIRYRRKDSASV